MSHDVYLTERAKWDDLARRRSNISEDVPYQDIHDYARRVYTMSGISEFLGPLDGQRVLEIGCGRGLLTVLAAKSGANVTGLDLSARSVSLARQRAVLHGVSNRVNFVVTVGETLPFPTESFDVVIGKAVLHHLDTTLGPPELHRVLKTGGKAAFSEPMGTNPLLSFARDHVPYPRKNPRGADHPLTYDDIQRWGAQYREYGYRELQFLSMLERALKIKRPLTLLRRLDDVLLEHLPFLRRYCRTVVLTMVK